jgi:hypothetical protein
MLINNDYITIYHARLRRKIENYLRKFSDIKSLVKICHILGIDERN